MERAISINGLRIRYLEEGKGLSVVLLHGYSFSADTWREISLFDELSKEYRVYSFDMPYGLKSKSDKFNAETRDEYALFLSDLLMMLNIRDPLLLGASISGEVTLRYLVGGHGAKAGIVVGPVGVKGLTSMLEKIAVPLLVVRGERDTISPSGDSKILATHVKNSEVHVIGGAGHACYLDKPEEFKMIVKDFIKRFAI
jgi:abhydrolase domain-containing protein 14